MAALGDEIDAVKFVHTYGAGLHSGDTDPDVHDPRWQRRQVEERSARPKTGRSVIDETGARRLLVETFSREEARLFGSFTILRFPLNGNGSDSEPPTVYADLYTGALYLDKPNEINRYTEAFNGIWENALDEPASRELIRKTAEALSNG
jgi:Domain of unknown function (DUF5753)